MFASLTKPTTYSDFLEIFLTKLKTSFFGANVPNALLEVVREKKFEDKAAMAK